MASGAAEALLLAREGAKVVVNDLGGSGDGEGADQTPAQQVVDEIKALGSDAVANYEDCSSWTGAEGMINQASRRSADSTCSSATPGSCATR